MRFYVLGKSRLNGVIGVHVTLASPAQTYCREQEILKMSGELMIRNQHLKQFAESLEILIDGKTDKVDLICME